MTDRETDRSREAAVVLGIFAVTRAAAWMAGVRFDASELDRFWHFIDLDLLAHRLAASLWWLHGQPPLFNLYLGVGVKAFGDGAPAFFAAASLAVGAAHALCALALLRALGAGPRLRVAVAAAIAASPVAILYDALLLYTTFCQLLVLAAALALAHAVRHGRERASAWALVFALCAALALTRSLFHVAWLALLVAGAAAVGGRTALMGAAAPTLAVLGWYGKNLALFGAFTASTWSGMSAARVALKRADPAVREALIAAGALTPLARIAPFSELEAYEGIVAMPPPTGEPLLDRPKKLSGARNLHHLAYVEIARRYRAEAVAMLAASPATVARGIAAATRRFFDPASDYGPLAENLARLDSALHLNSAYNAIAHFPVPGLGPVGPWPLLWPLIALAGTVASVRRRREPEGVVLAFLTVTLLWVTFAGCVGELGENNRFRLLAEPAAWILAAVVGAGLAQRQGQRSG